MGARGKSQNTADLPTGASTSALVSRLVSGSQCPTAGFRSALLATSWMLYALPLDTHVAINCYLLLWTLYLGIILDLRKNCKDVTEGSRIDFYLASANINILHLLKLKN